jgi:hypothetical protein
MEDARRAHAAGLIVRGTVGESRARLSHSTEASSQTLMRMSEATFFRERVVQSIGGVYE